MPAPTSVAEFLEVVRKSTLVPEDRLNAELNRLKSRGELGQSIDQLAQTFVDNGLLSKFQAKQVKSGRYKRFEVAGKYRLLELLGVGGMGAVYLCEHIFMKRLVALKVLPVEKLQDPSALLRFYREAQAVAALDHANIVRAYDIDKFEQMHFLVMEYVDGVSIQEIIARHGPLDPHRAANYVAQAAHGLHHAHHLGMVHRDIKPGNLLLERSGTIKILDMGLARFFEQKNDNITERFDNNCVLGTADYLAPEQAVSNVVDIRADIYALGGTFYFMLTGQSPFPDGTIAHKLLCHQNQDPKAVSTFRKDVPPELLAILERMMSKDPEERYQTPEELHEALLQIVDEEAVPPPILEMPDLCPLVLSLAGFAGEKVRSGQARIIAGSRSNGPGSSVIRTRTGPGSDKLRDARDVKLGGGSSGSRQGQALVNTAKTQNTAAMNPFGESDIDLMVADTDGASIDASRKKYLLMGLLGGLVMAALLAAVAVGAALALK